MENGKQRITYSQNVGFYESEDFTTTWEELRLSADDFFRLQDTIKSDPTIHPVVAGTGGLRKMRFARSSSGRGKRGSFRVCYVYVPAYAVIVLVMIYSKNEKEDLSPANKKIIKNWIRRLLSELERRFPPNQEN